MKLDGRLMLLLKNASLMITGSLMPVRDVCSNYTQHYQALKMRSDDRPQRDLNIDDTPRRDLTDKQHSIL